MKTAQQRFWEKVAIGPACWLWTATRQPLGYGHFWNDGRMMGAHRFAYEQRYGPIPEGKTVDHLCKVRHCVNPAHMEIVSLRENVLRSDNPPAINSRKTTCPSGHTYSVVLTGARKGERYCPTCRKLRRQS